MATSGGSSKPLGDLEHLVLLAVWNLGERAYGITVTDEISQRTGYSVSQGSIYTTLNRLENKGLLSSHRGRPRPVRGGRSRRYYRIEPEGREALHQVRAALEDMWAGLEPEPGTA